MPKKSNRQKLLAIITALLLIGAGVIMARYLLLNKPKAKRKPPETMKTTVQVKKFYPLDITHKIEALGTVLAAEELAFKPWLSGRVEYIHPALTPGGHLQKGEVVLELNRDDFKLALEQSRNALEKARMDLRLEEGSQAVAKREYALIREYSNTPVQEAPMDLALRKPQLAKAKAVEAAAQTEVERAELNLARTLLKAPFDAIVLKKEVTIGSQVSPQTMVAVLAGSKTFHIRVSVPRRDLDQILLPTDDKHPAGVEITSLAATGQQTIYRGRLLRVLTDVDPKGLMPRLLVEVNNPLQQHPDQPLLLGSVVKVTLPGKTTRNGFAVPRTAVRADKTVLLADDDSRLEIRKVEISWQDSEFIYVAQGLQQGERIILSPVAAPVTGMELTIAGSREPEGKVSSD